MSEATTTTDHDEIRRWVEERGGKPSRVKRTGGSDDPGILRILRRLRELPCEADDVGAGVASLARPGVAEQDASPTPHPARTGGHCR